MEFFVLNLFVALHSGNIHSAWFKTQLVTLIKLGLMTITTIRKTLMFTWSKPKLNPVALIVEHILY